jgi:hypothetical protein
MDENIFLDKANSTCYGKVKGYPYYVWLFTVERSGI